MLSEFPLIHTNVWDAVWAVPLTIVAVLAARWFFRVNPSWLSTVATATALILSIFISHPNSLSAGIFMGFFYSGAAMGVLYSLKLSYQAIRSE